MSAFENVLDFELWQAKWVLEGVEPEELVQIAVSALQNGFDGSALRELAGLTQPTSRELGPLPAKAFAEMGLKLIDKDAAVSILIDRGEPSTNPVVAVLRKAFPDFSERWRKYILDGSGTSSGPFTEMAEFVHFVVLDLYQKGNLAETRRAFELFEQLLVGADEETENLIALGFFETLQCFASWQPGGNKVYEQFLGPKSRQIWGELREIWAGKSSLMEVMRAEHKKE
jgi:hypothetical protein